MSGKDKKKFGAFKIIAIVVAVLIIGFIALLFFIDVNQFKPQIESRLTSALGRDVKTGKLSLSILSGGIGVDDIVIADDPAFSSSPFLQAKSLKVGVELKPLIFSKEVRITEIALNNPKINLIRNAQGRWNFSNIGGQTGKGNNGSSNSESGAMSPKDIAIKKLRISGGTLTIDQGGKNKKPSTYSDVNISASDLSFAAEFPFSLSAALPGGGSLSLKGNAGPISRTDLMTTPLSANLAVKKLDLIESGFVSPDTGLAGVVDFDGELTSDGRQVESKGTAKADRLQLVKGGSPAGRDVSLDYAVNYDLKQQRGVLDNARLAYGKAVANLNGDYRRQQSGLSMKMRLSGTDMPVDDLQTLLPAFGVVLPKGASLKGGLINTDMTAEGPIEKMSINGTADVSKTLLTGFDLAGKIAVLAQLAGIKPNPETEIETLASRVRMTPEGTRVDNIQLVVPALGELTGNGVINPDQALDFKMRAQLTPSGGIGANLTRLVGGGSGTLTIPFFIRGTASEPKFVPDVKNTAGSILKSQFSTGSGEEGEQKDPGKILGDTLKSLFGE
jgi:AsmA protein